MDKKLIIISSAIVILALAFIYMSFSPSTAPVSTNSTTGSENTKPGVPPPPPPTKVAKRVTAPPPPPPMRTKKNTPKQLPEGYVNYEVLERPEPILQLKPGSTKILKLNVKKGSEDFNIEWFKKSNQGLKKVNQGDTFSVSPEKTVVYYVATIDDKTNEPQNIFFQVEPLAENKNVETEKITKDAEQVQDTNTIAKNAEPVPVEKVAPTNTAEAANKTASPPKLTNIKPAKSGLKEIAVQAESKQAEVPEPVTEKPKEKFTITATKNTEVNAKIGSPLNISFNVEGDEKYQIFWFHRPFNKKKGSLIKKRKTLNFKLRKLNKYHKGYFYIKIKDSNGKFYKSPEYKVTLK